MEFPYSWQCQYSKKCEGPFTVCQCTIFPLYLIIQFHNQKKVLNINSTKFNNQIIKKSGNSDILHLICGKQIYYFHCLTKIDYNIVQKAFSYIFPLGGSCLLYQLDYQDYYHKQVPIDQFCVKDYDIYRCENIRMKSKCLLRSINMSKKDAVNQLQVLRRINVKIAMRPDQLYLQNHLFKLVYRDMTGTNLKKQIKKKKIYEEQQLSIFVKKILFFLQHLETAHIWLPNLKEELIILQCGSLSQPYIYDFSQAVITTHLSNRKLPFSNSIQQLGKIFYKLIKFQDYQQKCFEKIRSKENGIQYHKSMYQLIQKMLSSTKKQYSVSEALKHIWFKQVKSQVYNNLSTIVSLYSRQQRSGYILQFEQQDCSDIIKDDELSIQKYMQKHKSNILQPFSFKKNLIK